MKTRQLQHLYSRIGFGILPSEIQALSRYKKEILVAKLFSQSKKTNNLELDLSELSEFVDTGATKKLSKKLGKNYRKKADKN